MFEQQWSKKNLYLDLDLPQCEIVGNKELFNQMWINLVGNAVKYTDCGGKIGIRLDASLNDYITVEIYDDGIGMTEEVQKHIFDKFYQGDTSRKSQGNGLGLALVKTAADITGSTIEVKSQPQKGSTFTVKIPK